MHRFAAWFFALLCAATLAACSSQGDIAARSDDAANQFPANYKSDLLAMLRVYLNDPSNVRDAGVSEPFLQPIGGRNRYAVCVRLRTRTMSGDYSAPKAHVAYFAAGRLDQMIEANREQCDAATYQPFPEAERLSR